MIFILWFSSCILLINLTKSSMLLHFPIMILSISLIIGIFAISNVFQKTKVYSYKFLKSYLLFLVFLNISAITRLIQYYFGENVLIPIENYDSYLIFISILIPAMIIFFSFFLQLFFVFSIIKNLLVKNFIFKRYFYINVFFILVCLITIIILKDFFIKNIRFILNLLIPFGFLIGFIYLIIKIIGLNKKYSQKAMGIEKRKILKMFLYPVLIQYCFLIIIRILLTFDFIHGNQIFYLLLPLYYLLSNFYALSFLNIILKRSLKTIGILGVKDKSLVFFFQKHSFSKREQEVVGLLYSGKNNKEISDILYVSLQTIKFHISNVYKKAGIKNRGQLFNSILSSEQ